MQNVMSGANTNAAARAMRFFFYLELEFIDFVPDFEFRIAHCARRVRCHVDALGARKVLRRDSGDLRGRSRVLVGIFGVHCRFVRAHDDPP